MNPKIGAKILRGTESLLWEVEGWVSVSLIADIRMRAPVWPAFDVAVRVPPLGQAILDEPMGVKIGALGTPLEPLQSEAWVLGRAPRSPIAVQHAGVLKSLDSEYDTLYKYTFPVSHEWPEEVVLFLPEIRSSSASLKFPEVLLCRVPTKCGIEFRRPAE